MATQWQVFIMITKILVFVQMDWGGGMAPLATPLSRTYLFLNVLELRYSMHSNKTFTTSS